MIVLAGPNAVLRAMEFTRAAGERAIADWMCWPGWVLHVGCDDCAGNGRGAPCWGVRGCHGYGSGCGCGRCADRQARDLAGGQAA